MPIPAFYAVRAGRQTGVFMSWDECSEHVKGFPGAKYKKFINAAEAEAYLTEELVAGASSTSSAKPLNDKGKKRAIPGELEDESGWDVVYSDGACKGNGQSGSIAGIGVWWGRNDSRNMAERCPGDQTNNRAELIAILRILETTPRSKKPLLIKTDSSYSIQCFQSWLPNWRRNGFKTRRGSPVKNASLIRYLSAHLDARASYGQQVRLQHVKGHSGVEGNEGADAQANAGAMLPPIPEKDWESLEIELREQMKAEEATRSGDQLTVPMEVEADNSPTGNAMKVRKVSGDGSPASPARHLGSPAKGAEASCPEQSEPSSVPRLTAPPPAAIEAPSAPKINVCFEPEMNPAPSTVESKRIETSLTKPTSTTASPSPRKTVRSEARKQAIVAAMRSPSPTGESKPIKALPLLNSTSPDLSTSSSSAKASESPSRAQDSAVAMRSPSEAPPPKLASTEVAASSSPGKSSVYSLKTQTIIAALRSPSKAKHSKGQPSPPSRSPRKAPMSKVASVMHAIFPSKPTSAEHQKNSSPSKGTPSPTKMRSRMPLPRSPPKTVYPKDPPASSSSLNAQLTEAEESQPSQATAESYVTALTTITPMDLDTPPIEPVPVAQHRYASLPEQTTTEDPPKTPAKVVLDKKDIDFSMYADCLLDEEDVWKDFDP